MQAAAYRAPWPAPRLFAWEALVGNNPKLTALLSGAVAAWLIYGMATARESPSLALAVLQYVLIAGCVLGLVGAIRQMSAQKDRSRD